MLDILFVRVGEPCRLSRNNVEHLGIQYLASVLIDYHYNVAIIDGVLMELVVDELEEEIIENINSRIIAFTCEQDNWAITYRMIKKLKNNEFKGKILLGGYFPTFAYDLIMDKHPEIDYIIRGEGEKSILALMRYIDNQISIESIEGLVYRVNLDVKKNEVGNRISFKELFRPSRENIKKSGTSCAVSGSRGCYANCTFCSINEFYKLHSETGWIGRKAIDIVNELNDLFIDFKISNFHFVDDNFFGPGKNGIDRALEFSNLIIEKKMPIKYSFMCRAENVEFNLFNQLKKSGLDKVFIGIESGSLSILERMRKNTTAMQNKTALGILGKLEIYYEIGYMMFYPDMTLEELEENLTFLLDINHHDINLLFTKLELYIGTEVEKKYSFQKEYDVENGKLIISYLFEDAKIRFLYELITNSKILKDIVQLVNRVKEDENFAKSDICNFVFNIVKSVFEKVVHLVKVISKEDCSTNIELIGAKFEEDLEVYKTEMGLMANLLKLTYGSV